MHFFAMEFLEGPALDEVLAQRRLPWAEALDYTVATARGLRAALAHGFIHRDVKPSNLVLDRESSIKILDFGLVKSLHGDAELTRNGAIIGSPLYMAPEQGRGEEVDHRADIYSLGCALYHMLTGRPPFSGPSPVGVIAMHMSEVPPQAAQPGPRGARAHAANRRAHDGQGAGRPPRHLRRAHRLARGHRLGAARAFRVQGPLGGPGHRSRPGAAPLVPVRPLVPARGGGLLHPLPPSDRADPRQADPPAGGHRPERRPPLLEEGDAPLRGLRLGAHRLDPARNQRVLRAPERAGLVRDGPPDQAAARRAACSTCRRRR